MRERQETALARWKERWPDIIRGVKKPPKTEEVAAPVTLEDLSQRWIASAYAKVVRGELSKHTHTKYGLFGNYTSRVIGHDKLVSELGPDDFARLRESIAHKSLTHQSDFIVNVRGMFKWAAHPDVKIIPEPPSFGEHFTQPSRRALRLYRHRQGSKVIPAVGVRLMIHHCRIADPHFLPVILLGINCGMKAEDINSLRHSDISLERGFIDTIRSKTSAEVLAHLWPETIRAIQDVAFDGDPILRHRSGLPWYAKGTSRIAKTFARMRTTLGLPEAWQHQWLRHTLRTIGGKNNPAVGLVMGHVDTNVLSEIYNHDTMEDEVREVSLRVRRWLFSASTSSPVQEASSSPVADAASSASRFPSP